MAIPNNHRYLDGRNKLNPRLMDRVKEAITCGLKFDDIRAVFGVDYYDLCRVMEPPTDSVPYKISKEYKENKTTIPPNWYFRTPLKGTPNRIQL